MSRPTFDAVAADAAGAEDRLAARLTELGAVRTGPRTHHFGAPDAEAEAVQTGPVIADLSHLGIAQAMGRDAVRFLQAQLTNDIEALAEDHHTLAAWCDPKGRTQALFRIYRQADACFLLAPSEILDSVLPRLERFRLRAKLSLTRLDPGVRCLGLNDVALTGLPAPAPALQRAGAVVRSEPTPGALTWLALSASHALVVAASDRLETLWTTATAGGVRPVGQDAWALCDVTAGLPQIYPATAGEFVPQMVNLDLLGGISFSKGCYPGQEIVARSHYLGRIKRRMHGFVTAAASPLPLPGESVLDGAGNRVGQVVEAGRAPHGGAALLCVIREAAMTDGASLHLAGDAQIRLQHTPLPYPLDTATGTATPSAAGGEV